MKAQIERMRRFFIESPFKMTKAHGVGNVAGSVQRVLADLPGLGLRVTEYTVRQNARILAEL